MPRVSRAVDAAALAFAAWTLLCHATVFAGGSLHVLLALAALSAGALGAAAWTRRLPGLSAAPDPRGDARLLWTLGALGALLALVAHRPDSDDTLYLSFAAGVADFPDAPLLRDDAMLGIPGLPIYLPVYKVHALEILGGAFARLSGLSVTAFHHLLQPAAAGFLLPLAQARLLRILAGARWRWALAGALAVLLLDGAGHANHANFGFVRLQQGKAVFLSVWAPLIVAYALEYSARPARGRLLLLAAAVLGGVGLTSTALWVAPALCALALLAARAPGPAGNRTLAAGLWACAYPAALALALRSSMRDAVAADWALRQGQVGAYVLHALERGLGPLPHGLFVLAAAASAWAFAPRGAARRVALVFPLAFAALFNPLAAPFVAANLTSLWNYSRLAWLLPLPALYGLIAAGVEPERGARSARNWGAALLFLPVLLPPVYTLSRANHVRLRAPGPKVPAQFAVVEAIARHVPAGAYVLAPSAPSAWLPTLRRHPYPLLTKVYEYKWEFRGLPREDVERRKALMAHVGGFAPARLPDAVFAAGLQLYRVSGVCFNAGLPWAEPIRDVLTREGYAACAREGGYEVWGRPREEPESDSRGSSMTWSSPTDFDANSTSQCPNFPVRLKHKA